MGNHIEPDGCSRDIERCYGHHPQNGHFYAENVRVFYPTDPDKPNLVTCPVIERRRCGVRAKLQGLSNEEIDQLPPCMRLQERYTTIDIEALSKSSRPWMNITPFDAGSPYHW